MKKEIILIGIILLFGMILVIATPSQMSNETREKISNLFSERDNDSNQRIGGQTDEHGCLIPAGYSWNSSEEKCVREWVRGEGRYQNRTGERENESNRGIGQELRERKREFREGNISGPQGQFMNVREIVAGLKEMDINRTRARTRLNMTIEEDENNQTILRVKLKNGQEKEIKIMPDTASEKALERLRIKVCSEDQENLEFTTH